MVVFQSNSPISGLLQKPRNDRGVEFVLRETCSMLLGGVAVVLQMAHPFVAFGVKHHSYVYDNIVLRFVRTFEYVLGIQFGTSEQSIRAALQVRAIHSRVHGTIEEDCTGLNGPAAGTATALDTGSGSGSDIDSGSGHNSTNSGGSSDGDDLSADRLERARMPLGVPLSGVSGWPRGYVYSAYDERAALWVFATLSELAMVGADIFANGGGAAAPVLSDSESEEIYHDTKLNAGVWGISQSTFPTDWHAFRVYFGRMCASPLLCGTSTPVQRITATIMPVPLWGLIPGFHPFQSMTAVLLPDRLRIALFGPYNNALSSVLDRLQAVHFYTVVSLIYCMIPGPMRWFTEYNTRFARIELAASGKPIPSDDADIRLPMLARMGKYFGHVLVKSYLDFITPTKPQPSATANVTAAAAAS